MSGDPNPKLWKAVYTVKCTTANATLAALSGKDISLSLTGEEAKEAKFGRHYVVTVT